MPTKEEILEMVKKFNKEEAYRAILRFISQKMLEAHVDGVILGLSGGIDSALTLKLVVDAIGSDKTHVLIMPHPKLTPKKDVDDAYLLVEKFGVRNVIEINIEEAVNGLLDSLRGNGVELDKYSYGNILARARMTLLYAVANSKKLMVVGTGDKSEILIGYFTKYGDGGVDILPIGDLYKTRVREMGKYLGLPDGIVNKPSSPRLWEDHIAERELGVSYSDVDVILYSYIDLRYPIEKLFSINGLNKEHIKIVLERVYKTEHKRMIPPIAKLFGSMTVGNDWRMPFSYKLEFGDE
ncbi:MAG: NAD+ synthase [Candidatus Njordarchaeia archaeon]